MVVPHSLKAHEFDDGVFWVQLTPSRVRDLSTGELRYRWTEAGALDYYRHAHVFDHLAGDRWTGEFEVSLIG